jgi:hypothetical protein
VRKYRVVFLVYRFWQRPWGFHRYYTGRTPDTYAGWIFGLYVIGIEYRAATEAKP